MHLCDRSSSATSATHVIWVQLYGALHGAATIHKTSEMTHIDKQVLSIWIYMLCSVRYLSVSGDVMYWLWCPPWVVICVQMCVERALCQWLLPDKWDTHQTARDKAVICLQWSGCWHGILLQHEGKGQYGQFNFVSLQCMIHWLLHSKNWEL